MKRPTTTYPQKNKSGAHANKTPQAPLPDGDHVPVLYTHDEETESAPHEIPANDDGRSRTRTWDLFLIREAL